MKKIFQNEEEFICLERDYDSTLEMHQNNGVNPGRKRIISNPHAKNEITQIKMAIYKSKSTWRTIENFYK
jgi:uncharacterized protein YpmB